MNFREAEDQAFSQVTVYVHRWSNANRRPSEYFWCQWCEGFYGVKHGTWLTPGAPNQFGQRPCGSAPGGHSPRKDCVCRRCQIELGVYGQHGSWIPAYLVNIHNQTFAAA